MLLLTSLNLLSRQVNNNDTPIIITYLITIGLGHYWANVQLRRKFFEKFAKEHQFDPLVASSWYSITEEQIMESEVCPSLSPFLETMTNIQFKNAISVLSYYNKNFKKALTSLFPEIGLERRFYYIPSKF